jgi:hypothetical protein
VAHVALESAASDIVVTTAWFGADGWLVAQEQKSATGAGQHQLDFDAPEAIAAEKGPHHVDVRVGDVHIADAGFVVQ